MKRYWEMVVWWVSNFYVCDLCKGNFTGNPNMHRYPWSEKHESTGEQEA